MSVGTRQSLPQAEILYELHSEHSQHRGHLLPTVHLPLRLPAAVEAVLRRCAWTALETDPQVLAALLATPAHSALKNRLVALQRQLASRGFDRPSMDLVLWAMARDAGLRITSLEPRPPSSTP